MALIQGHFGYRSVHLIKNEASSLGHGSYGAVYKAKCDQLPCAAKVLHPILFSTRDPASRRIVERFEQECEFLSGIRHPNIIQYLGTCRDPESGLPVLLMELMDESLTSFLERSDDPPPLPFHIQVNISLDVAQALAYLHSNEIVHRDLSSNNVLLISSSRAKVTDFGMAKLAATHPRPTPTFCPGTMGYMSPEALREPPAYTMKLDIFSCGVLQIQIITRKFPDPGPRMQAVEVGNDPRFRASRVHIEVPELERRRSHIDLIDPTHPLLRIALDCLKDKEGERPSAEQLCSYLTALSEAPRYQESLQQAQQAAQSLHEGPVPPHRTEMNSLTKSMEQLQLKSQRQLQEKETQIQQKERDIQQMKKDIQQKERGNHYLQQEVHQKEEQVQQLRHELHQTRQDNEQLVATLQHSLDQKDEVIKSKEQALQGKERQIRELRQSQGGKTRSSTPAQRFWPPWRRRQKELLLDILAVPNVTSNAVNTISPRAAATSMGITQREPGADFSQEGSAGSESSSNSFTRRNSSYMREMERLIISHEQLTLLNTIGQGEFSIVYKAKLTSKTTHAGCDRVVAVKTLKGYFDQSDVDKILEESLKMRKFNHLHVMGIIGVCLDAGPAPYIVMPYMANGSLLSYLKRERRRLILKEDADEDLIREACKGLTMFCSQIAYGMKYLAEEKFVHRDLAARNCMIDLNFVIKIADFGLTEDVYARHYFRQSSSDEVVKLPVKWMAPESLNDGHFSEKSDVWSYGVTVWEIFSGGKSPYPGLDPLTMIQLLEAGQRMNKPTNAACRDEMYATMMKCWEFEPGNRPSFQELHENISSYSEKISGYLKVTFAGTGGER